MENYTQPDCWWQKYQTEYQNRTWRDYRWLLVEAISYAPEPPLIDIGCGYGFLVEAARVFGISATGLEASSSAIAFCKKQHPQADVREWKAGSPLPFPDKSAGVIVLNEFIDHITLSENQHLFKEICRILKPEGILIVKSPSRYNRFDHDLGHQTFFSPKEFFRFVESYQLKVIKQPYILQPLLGHSKLGWWILKNITRFIKPEKWAATINLVAQNPKIR